MKKQLILIIVVIGLMGMGFSANFSYIDNSSYRMCFYSPADGSRVDCIENSTDVFQTNASDYILKMESKSNEIMEKPEGILSLIKPLVFIGIFSMLLFLLGMGMVLVFMGNI